ncbi:MAG: hypothetical protein JO089_06515 [Alphaproteobacteria bacterium]|nr:hypothetical protein [Alphaproteobacteria bacterium]
MDGLLLTMVNPKAWVMQAMMFSQFLKEGQAWVDQTLSLSAGLAVLNISGHMVWTLFGSFLICAPPIISRRAQNAFYAAMPFGSIIFLM